MRKYEVTMVCSPATSSLENIKIAMEDLTIPELLVLKKDIIELINKKVNETNDH